MNNDFIQQNELRPTGLEEFVGREQEKKLIRMMVSSAKTREDSLDHLLFYGPPGLGKTTLAMIISKEMNSNLIITSAPSISSKSDIASIIMNLNDGDILFIDEIHRLSKIIEEFLYPIMEDYAMDIVMGKGLSANVVRVPVKKFTLIGATTKVSNISDPLRDRFGHLFHLDYYNEAEINQILFRSTKILNISLSEDIMSAISQRSRGTARVANNILKIVRDYILVNNKPNIQIEELEQILMDVGLDNEGLDKMDRKILETIYIKFENQPVSLSTLVAAISEDKRTIEEYYEPHLIKKGFIQKTTRGRVITAQGIKHIKKYL